MAAARTAHSLGLMGLSGTGIAKYQCAASINLQGCNPGCMEGAMPYYGWVKQCKAEEVMCSVGWSGVGFEGSPFAFSMCFIHTIH